MADRRAAGGDFSHSDGFSEENKCQAHGIALSLTQGDLVRLRAEEGEIYFAAWSLYRDA
jgi:hypothetical protein